jgi:hypothetical protein
MSASGRILRNGAVTAVLLACFLCSCSSGWRGVPPVTESESRDYSLALSHPAQARIEQLYYEARGLFDNKMYEESIQKFEDVRAMIRVHHHYVDQNFGDTILNSLVLGRVCAF